MEGLRRFNNLARDLARSQLLRCCGSKRWVEAVLARRPFGDTAELLRVAQTVWEGLGREDWLEAFRHHPRIGDTGVLGDRCARTPEWAAQEQASVAGATPRVLEDLAEGNRAYASKFGYIFIVCATGKSAQEMLGLLRERLGHDPSVEIRIAAEEQGKITRIRLEKLLKGLLDGHLV